MTETAETPETKDRHPLLHSLWDAVKDVIVKAEEKAREEAPKAEAEALKFVAQKLRDEASKLDEKATELKEGIVNE